VLVSCLVSVSCSWSSLCGVPRRLDAGFIQSPPRLGGGRNSAGDIRGGRERADPVSGNRPFRYAPRRSLVFVVSDCQLKAPPPESGGGRVCYSMISETTPDPTVRPPSLMANRRPWSMAIGWISSISIWTLSPGMTISTPSGSLATPVTSVVRK
jgi:hypothetical protein